MTQVASIQNLLINDDNSTQKQQQGLGVAKKIKKKEKGCHCRQQKQRKIYKFISPEESSYECDGWEEEDLFNRQSENRRQNKEITDLKCVAWNLELFIKNAKEKLAYLEGTMQLNLARN
ncbi:unnamed protein product (macronuclear) [Paramecium tetraurelia]|uniref:Uncharacterized protein n=1 Tax=Paramecium tetraurelia TaxID=5888 RepID=A0C209_PARTE|nr:uncharacterized protein GSPATT00034303001 [Paramecium tetraurelia]CAK64826.1 unnamed protein product [Paramecium tetraurelia]|eukprot:XP_001432223.1 hypothetical protein (macronuclear) [Paramecium tetraurelia strain d4-2]